MKYRIGQIFIATDSKIKIDESVCDKIDSWSSYNARKSTEQQPVIIFKKDDLAEMLNTLSKNYFLLYSKDYNITFRVSKSVLKFSFTPVTPYYNKIWNEVNEIQID